LKFASALLIQSTGLFELLQFELIFLSQRQFVAFFGLQKPAGGLFGLNLFDLQEIGLEPMTGPFLFGREQSLLT
jgi:hypothetical protein